MKVHLKIIRSQLLELQQHLRTPHPVALERVGFLACRGAWLADGVVLLGRQFLPVHDDEYAEDENVGARITAHAVRAALQHSFHHADCMLFVHEHGHTGRPRPSQVDLKCWRELIPNFWHVRSDLPHGGLILSEDSAFGMLWIPGEPKPAEIDVFTVVGPQLQRWGRGAHGDSERVQ